MLEQREEKHAIQLEEKRFNACQDISMQINKIIHDFYRSNYEASLETSKKKAANEVKVNQEPSYNHMVSLIKDAVIDMQTAKLIGTILFENVLINALARTKDYFKQIDKAGSLIEEKYQVSVDGTSKQEFRDRLKTSLKSAYSLVDMDLNEQNVKKAFDGRVTR